MAVVSANASSNNRTLGGAQSLVYSKIRAVAEQQQYAISKSSRDLSIANTWHSEDELEKRRLGPRQQLLYMPNKSAIAVKLLNSEAKQIEIKSTTRDELIQYLTLQTEATLNARCDLEQGTQDTQAIRNAHSYVMDLRIAV